MAEEGQNLLVLAFVLPRLEGQCPFSTVGRRHRGQAQLHPCQLQSALLKKAVQSKGEFLQVGKSRQTVLVNLARCNRRPEAATKNHSQ